MYYFIPAWYREDSWHHPHTDGRLSYSFDDTVNQVRMFAEYGEPVTLLVLAYQPALRLTLHGQYLSRVPYVSVFDRLQGLEASLPQSLDLGQLAWPEGLEPVYTPYFLDLRQGLDLYARVRQGLMGYVSQIDFYRGGQLARSCVMDDRGLVSSVVYYQEGQARYQDYYYQGRQPIFRHALDGSDQVQVMSDFRDFFMQESYPSLTALLAESVGQLAQDLAPGEDGVIFAAHGQHNALVMESFAALDRVPTFFQKRAQVYDLDTLIEAGSEVPLMVADSDRTAAFLESQLAAMDPRPALYQITPFDTRLTLGKSQRVKEQKIALVTDGLSLDSLRELLALCLDLSQTLPRLTFTLLSGGRGPVDGGTLEGLAQDFQAQVDAGVFADVVEDFEDKRPDEDKQPVFTYVEVRDDFALIQVLEEVRVLVDLSPAPQLFLQIAAISVGIPQINARESSYVHHQKNGYIAPNLAGVREGLVYYCSGLQHWNEALVYSVNLINDHYNARVVERWKAALKESKYEQA